jgi:ubiquinone/menaquinone biosynthesis C-methylase UbiE
MSERTHGKSPDEHGRIVREGYDNIAEEYTKDRDNFDNDQEIQEFIDHLPKEAIVLDIGCGGGVPVLQTLIDNSYEAAGIDFSNSMLEVAKKNVPQATLIHGDVTKTAFDENSFDGIISTYAIIHIHKSLHPTLASFLIPESTLFLIFH